MAHPVKWLRVAERARAHPPWGCLRSGQDDGSRLGLHDRQFGSQVLQALVVGAAVLDATYLLLLGGSVIDVLRRPDSIAEKPRAAALAILLLAVGIPAALAYLIHGRPSWTRPKAKWLAWLRVPAVRSGYETTPTGWDKVAPTRGGYWVRVRVGDGKWIGGWIGNRLFVSTSPEAPDPYIEDQHHVAPGGTIGDRVQDSAGV